MGVHIMKPIRDRLTFNGRANANRRRHQSRDPSVFAIFIFNAGSAVERVCIRAKLDDAIQLIDNGEDAAIIRLSLSRQAVRRNRD
jgi:hypothetical protein